MPRIAVVFPSWRIPEHRLRDQFMWNDWCYRSGSVHVFAVTDRQYEVPDYAECVVFPEDRFPMVRGQRRFATTRCRNAGIQAAIQAGFDLIMCTEVDIAMEPEAWDTAGVVSGRTASVPHCRMSNSSEFWRREESWVTAPSATGTVTMTTDAWGTVQYCEEQWGYGRDDGLMLDRLASRKIHVDRTGYIYHMAHIDGANQREFHGRCDHWNRDSGFNPENFRHNRKFQ